MGAPVVSKNMEAPKTIDPFSKKEDHKRKNSTDQRIVEIYQAIKGLPPEILTHRVLLDKVVFGLLGQEGLPTSIGLAHLLKKVVEESSQESNKELELFFRNDQVLYSLLNKETLPDSTQQKSIPEVVKISFKETNFADISNKLNLIFTEDDELRNDIFNKITQFNAYLLNLQTPHKTNDSTKGDSIKNLGEYSLLLTRAESSRNSLKEQGKAIQDLKTAITNVTTAFKAENDKRRRHFETVFEDLIHKHGLLQDIIINPKEKAGQNSTTVRTLGVTKTVEEPKKSTEKISIDVCADTFSDFYMRQHKFYEAECKELVRDLESHVAKVTCKRSTLTTLDPEYEKKKLEALNYREEYQKIAQRTGAIYKYLEVYTESCEKIEKVLIEMLDKHVQEINTKLLNLKKNMDSLLKSCNDLDMQINKNLKETKDFKAFVI